MTLKGKAKADWQREYMREYMRRKRAGMRPGSSAPPPGPKPEPEPAKPPPPPSPGWVPRPRPEFSADEKERAQRLRVRWNKARNLERSYRISGIRASFDKSRKYHAEFMAEIAEVRKAMSGKRGAFETWCMHALQIGASAIPERAKIYKDTPEEQERFDLAQMERIERSSRAKTIRGATHCLGLSTPISGENEYVAYLWKRLGRE